MNGLNDLRIGLKLTIGFAVVVAVLIASGIVAQTRLATVNQTTQELETIWLPSTRILGTINTKLADRRVREFSHVLSEDAGAFASDPSASAKNLIEKEIAELDEMLLEYFDQFAARASTDDERQALETLRADYQEYVQKSQKVLSLSQDGRQAAAEREMQGSRGLYDRMHQTVDQMIVVNMEGGIAAAARGDDVFQTSRLWLISVSVLAVFLAGAAGFVLRKAIVVPLMELVGAMRGLADHDTAVTIPGIGRGDELGAMAATVQVFKDNMLRADELAEEQEARRQARERRAEAVERLTGEFDHAVAGMLDTVMEAGSQLEATASSMSATAEQTNRQATIVAAATEQASSSVQTVASAAEELSASIAEIGRQVDQSTRSAQEACDEAERTDSTVRGLAETSSRIGDVVNLINSIASQTNLLALNATIEAARAGDAGKGFAVVAGEVKNLANQTAKATEEISSQIAAVQLATKSAVDAIAAIVGRIREVNEIASNIAAAVEEQSSATAEIARNVQQAAQGTQEVASTIGGVTRAASESGVAASEVLNSAQGLNRQADALKAKVHDFLGAVRST